MHKLENIRRFVFLIILIEYLLIFILIINKINKLNESYKKLNDRLEKQEIQSKLYYEDILDLLERKL